MRVHVAAVVVFACCGWHCGLMNMFVALVQCSPSEDHNRAGGDHLRCRVAGVDDGGGVTSFQETRDGEEMLCCVWCVCRTADACATGELVVSLGMVVVSRSIQQAMPFVVTSTFCVFVAGVPSHSCACPGGFKSTNSLVSSSPTSTHSSGADAMFTILNRGGGGGGGMWFPFPWPLGHASPRQQPTTQQLTTSRP